eukprot:Tbor_TRINITY_DN4861_c0_g1::TRINITY_DN4861_c0_g1_i1::g.1424::m.1424
MNQLRFLPHDTAPQRRIPDISSSSYLSRDSGMSNNTKFLIRDQGTPGGRRKCPDTIMTLGPVVQSRQFHNNWSKRVHDLLLGKCTSGESVYSAKTVGASSSSAVSPRAATSAKEVNITTPTKECNQSCQTINNDNRCNLSLRADKFQQISVEINSRGTNVDPQLRADVAVQFETSASTERQKDEKLSFSRLPECHREIECISPLSESILSDGMEGQENRNIKIGESENSMGGNNDIHITSREDLCSPKDVSDECGIVTSPLPPSPKTQTVTFGIAPNDQYHNFTRDYQSLSFVNDQHATDITIDARHETSWGSPRSADRRGQSGGPRRLRKKDVSENGAFFQSVTPSRRLERCTKERSIPLYFDPGPDLLSVTSPCHSDGLESLLPSYSSSSSNSYFEAVMDHLSDRCNKFNVPARNHQYQGNEAILPPRATSVKKHQDYGQFSQQVDVRGYRYSSSPNLMQCVSFTHLASPFRGRSLRPSSGKRLKEESPTPSKLISRHSPNPSPIAGRQHPKHQVQDSGLNISRKDRDSSVTKISQPVAASSVLRDRGVLPRTVASKRDNQGEIPPLHQQRVNRVEVRVTNVR